MIRQTVASVIDASATALLAYVGFRIALAVAPCRNLGQCVILTPLIVLGIAIAVGAYFLLGWRLFGSTFARRVTGADSPDSSM